MLAHTQTIRDVSRALPALVADPDLDGPVSADLLDAHTTGLRQRYDDLFPVIDRAGNALAEATKKLDSEHSPDPTGEGVPALEQGETYFKQRREKLEHLRCALLDVGAPTEHDVFGALDRLDDLYVWIVATMQEVRWSLLIQEGLRDRARAPERRSFTSSADWLASVREE